ncbi:hypothetical protein [Sphingobacterium sp. FBM7-1]|uniref:hypothetical protein n=1 Tax=Sphingobacterium sp. FBM7-1 TaxID=2886688 RepID=UPI001D10E819|nr:hypothetical protein [Sphingobacterium sp. FBM7-1]MCC2599664.1 hypothetical protein [Sphingobacterium sp. FBM7-1]
MKTPFLILLQTLWLIFALASTSVSTTMQVIPGSIMEYWQRLEDAWYRYKAYCNEPP